MSKENRQCVAHYDTTTMLLMMAASLFLCLSNLRHLPRTTFKQPSRGCSTGWGWLKGGGGEGGGLVCEENKGSQPIFHFFCSRTHPTQLPKVHSIPLWMMRVYWIIELLSSPLHKWIECILGN